MNNEDLKAAKESLAEYNRDGGTSLEDVKEELGMKVDDGAHVHSVEDKTIIPAEDNTIVLWTSSPEGEIKKLLTIGADGTIVRGPNFTTVDQASLDFWKLVEEQFPPSVADSAEKEEMTDLETTADDRAWFKDYTAEMGHTDGRGHRLALIAHQLLRDHQRLTDALKREQSEVSSLTRWWPRPSRPT